MKKILMSVLAVLLMVSVSFAGSPAVVDFNNLKANTLIVTKDTKGFPAVGGWQLYHELFYVSIFDGICPPNYIAEFPNKIEWIDQDVPLQPEEGTPIYKVSYLKKSVQLSDSNSPENATVIKEQYVITTLSLICADQECGVVEEVKICPIGTTEGGGFGSYFKPVETPVARGKK